TVKVDLFLMDYLVIPFVEDNHMYLIIVVQPSKCISPVRTDRKTTRQNSKKESEAESFVIILDSLYDPDDKKRACSFEVIR
ncbi:hypothetical protein PMAYCL1PPCAC_08183, partial [Pristionchus mayeri]